MIDDRKATYAIISYPNDPCQVRHSPVLLPISDCTNIFFFSYQLHANCRALHKYTWDEKKKARRGVGPGFDGDLNNFQAPQLSSLAKLVSTLLSGYCNRLTDAWIRI